MSNEYRTIYGKEIFYQTDDKIVHAAEGGFTPDNKTRILWTLCEIDIPSNQAFTSKDARVECEACCKLLELEKGKEK